MKDRGVTIEVVDHCASCARLHFQDPHLHLLSSTKASITTDRLQHTRHAAVHGAFTSPSASLSGSGGTSCDRPLEQLLVKNPKDLGVRQGNPSEPGRSRMRMNSRDHTTGSRYTSLLLHTFPYYVHEVSVYFQCVHDDEHHTILRPIRQIHGLGHQVVMNPLGDTHARVSTHLQPCARGDDSASTSSLKHYSLPL